MVNSIRRLSRLRLTGWLVCACLVLEPLLLFGHVLTEAHCVRVDHERSELCRGAVEHEHEGEGELHHGHHDHCPLSLIDHLRTLTGNPAELRKGSAAKPVHVPIAAGSPASVDPGAPVFRCALEEPRVDTPTPGVSREPPCPRGPPPA